MNLTYFLILILFIDLVLSLLNSKTINIIGLIKLGLITLSYIAINNKAFNSEQLLLASSFLAFVTSNDNHYKIVLNFFIIYIISNNGIYNMSSYEYSVLVFLSIIAFAFEEFISVAYFILIFPTVCKLDMISAFAFYSLFSSLVVLRRSHFNREIIRKSILSLIALGLLVFMDFTQTSKLLTSINIVLFTGLLIENLKLIRVKEA
jgi:hypothetical protein